MNKKYIVRKNEEIQDIIINNIKIVDNFYIIYYKESKNGFNRFCISVSKKIGKANIRNLLKRRIKDILMKNIINSSYDYVIILRNGILNLSYEEMKEKLIYLLKGDKK